MLQGFTPKRVNVMNRIHAPLAPVAAWLFRGGRITCRPSQVCGRRSFSSAFEPTEDHMMLRNLVREFAEKEVDPQVQRNPKS